MLTKDNRQEWSTPWEELKVVSTDNLYLLQVKQMFVVT